MERFEERIVFAGPQLISIIPNQGAVLLPGDTRHEAPRELIFRFDGAQDLDPATLGGIQLSRAGNDGEFVTNSIAITPGYLALGDRDNEVVMRFNSKLVDDLYRVTIVGSGPNALRNRDGEGFLQNGSATYTQDFRLDLGAQVMAVVPQPVAGSPGARTQARAQIDVYFNNDDLNVASAQNPNFYQLIRTNDNATSTGDVRYTPFSVTYNAAQDKATLLFDTNGDLSVNGLDDLASLGSGAYRLRIGNSDPLPIAPVHFTPAADPGDTFTGALGDPNRDLGVLAAATHIVSSEIVNTSIYPLELPGGNDEPGHRDIPQQDHLEGPADQVPGISTFTYNFPFVYGQNEQNQDVQNEITDTQRQRVREVFELYSRYLGVQFVEVSSTALGAADYAVATGSLTAIDPTIPPNNAQGISDPFDKLGVRRAVVNGAIEWGDAEFGGRYFRVAMHEIGKLLGLGESYELPSLTVQGTAEDLLTQVTGELVFPGDHDIVHGQHLFRPESTDVDLYRFELTAAGRVVAETFAERLSTYSHLDTVLTLYQEVEVTPGVFERTVIARNDDYFSSDSFLDLTLSAGVYYIGVSSTGNISYDPNLTNSGFGGRTEGAYDLRVEFTPLNDASDSLIDANGTVLDGDLDGKPGGEYNFWFNVQVSTSSTATNRTIFVDKAYPAGFPAPLGTLARPFRDIDDATAFVNSLLVSDPTANPIIRVLANGASPATALPYLVGKDSTVNQNVLADGASLDVPRNTTLMVDAGVVMKLQKANVDVGSSALGVNRSRSALQVLGTPGNSVYFTSYRNDALGGNSDIFSTTPGTGNWGGLVFRSDSDREQDGIFLNYVSNANITYGGGIVRVNTTDRVFSPIELIEARPTLVFNTITDNADAAIAGDPNSFEESRFLSNTVGSSFTTDYDRVGPEIFGNTLLRNSINALFLRIKATPSSPLTELTTSARFDDADITHVITENLIIRGTPGGPLDSGAGPQARLDARLAADAGILIKLSGARIETTIGAQFIAEAESGGETIFTSLLDDTRGASGTFDTNNNGAVSVPDRGNWGGLYFAPNSKGSLDHVVITYAGGKSTIEGGTDFFNPLEIRQADVRVTRSRFEKNDNGLAATNRTGRGVNDDTIIFILGAQPILVDNTFDDNLGSMISANVNALSWQQQADYGRTRGSIQDYPQFSDNAGPLIRLNTIDNVPITNVAINGMVVRGGVVTTQTVWDDTDIVHVLLDEVVSDNQHTYGGVRLQSSPTESLVVKLDGPSAGFTARGTPLDIDDRIGGTVQIVGTPNHPVILTSLEDVSVGAGLTLDGRAQNDTHNSGAGQDVTVTIPPYADVIVVADESGSMFNYQQFSKSLIAALDAGLLAAGIGTQPGAGNQFGLVGYGGGGVTNEGHSLQVGAGLFGTSVEYAAAVDNLTISGASEDGYAGVHYALQNYTFRNNSKRFIILVTDEDRDIDDNTVTFNSLLGDLNAADASLQVIVSAAFRNGANQAALAIDASDIAYLEDGLGGFTTSPGGFVFSDFGTTEQDYIDMARATGGISGNIDLINNGPPTSTSFANAMITSIVAQAGGGNPAAAGDWRSVKFEQYSNDRNVQYVQELERRYTNGTEANGSPGSAQLLGILAPDEKSGDDNLRLGFEVHGYVAFDAPQDVDVYSFSAKEGTEVWFDIDRTSNALDVVLELVDAAGNVYARSNDSLTESAAGAPDFLSPGTRGYIMQRSTIFVQPDFYSTNPRDAGLRVLLPDGPDEYNTYYVRVRSAGATNPSDPFDPGVTRGAYQLQIRLRELDETPGSLVSGSEIRYATNAIEVIGLPSHSPLIGETGDNPSDTNNEGFNGAQQTGNLLTSERNTISIAGTLASAADVDWFRFDLNYDLIQVIQNYTDGGKSWATIFDIDYADGLSRPDTTLSVFDQFGNLIFVSRDSDVLDDQPAPGQGIDIDDLSRGSFGKRDPYIGSVQLPTGVIPAGTSRTYYVAISSDARLPSALNATFNASPTNANIRLEPISSLKRVVEDHIGFTGYTTGSTDRFTTDTVQPETSALLPITTVEELRASVRPYTLSDVTLYREIGSSDLRTLDPATGLNETYVGLLSNHSVQDIGFRADGRLYGYRTVENPTESAANEGMLLLIDPATGQTTEVGGDLINSSRFPEYTHNSDTPDALALSPFGDATIYYSVRDVTFQRSWIFSGSADSGAANTDWGQILTSPFITLNSAFVVTHGSDPAGDFVEGSTFTVDDGVHPPTVFEFESGPDFLVSGAITGAAIPDNTVTFQLNGKTYEFDIDGTLLSPTNVPIVYGTGDGSTTLAARIATAFNSQGLNAVAVRNRITVAAGNETTYFPDVTTATFLGIRPGTGLGVAPGNVAVPFDANDTPVDLVQKMATAINGVGNTLDATATIREAADGLRRVLQIEFSTGVVLSAPLLGAGFDLLGNGPGGFIMGLAAGNDGSLYGVSSNGGVYRIDSSFREFDPTLGWINSATNYLPNSRDLVKAGYRFQGMSRGPQNLDANGDGVPGDLANTFLATSTNGTLGHVVFFDYTGKPVNVQDNDGNGVYEFDARTEATDNARGIALSPLDWNLWHPTLRRGRQTEHGTYAAPDASRDGEAEQFIYTNADGIVHTENTGGASFWFGFDETTALDGQEFIQGSPRDYVFYNEYGGQYGVVDASYQDFLSSNPAIGNNYNLPGGAQGSLITNSFSLEGYARTDRPTLYFDYFLQTQNAASSYDQFGILNTMRDSARVFASTDGGLTWQTLATNNATRSPFQTYPTSSELPQFATVSSDVPMTTGPGGAPIYDPRQRVQELFDTGNWRQARIDLGDFVGSPNIMLRFDFSTSGSMRDPTGSIDDVVPGDEFGNPFSAERLRNNTGEGFYVDNILVGFAERGEMVTGAVAGQTDYFQVPQNPNVGAPQQQLTGAYQLEIRRGEESATLATQLDNATLQTPAFDTNDRLGRGFTIYAPDWYDETQVILAPGPGQQNIQFSGVPAPTGGGRLRIEITGDLEGAQERIKFDLESLLSQDLFIDTARQGQVYTATINLSQAQLAALTADGVVNVALTRGSLRVDGLARIEVQLEYATLPLDEQTFDIWDGLTLVTFEFDSNNSLTNANHKRIAFTGAETGDALAKLIRDAINSEARLRGVTAASHPSSNRVDVMGAEEVTGGNSRNVTATVTGATTIGENGGSTTVEVRREGSTALPLSVTLRAIDVLSGNLSSDVSLNGGGNTIVVLIPAGSASINVTLTGVNDALLEGRETVRIIPAAFNFNSESDTLDVTDDEARQIVVTTNIGAFAENVGPAIAAAIGTVNLGFVAERATEVFLRTLDASEIVVPYSVIVAAGAQTATFPIYALDDLIIDGAQIVTIVASAVNFLSGETTVTVTDAGGDALASNGSQWIPIGPNANLDGQVENVTPGNPVNGAVQRVLPHPTNPNIMYVAAVNGGVWRTDNATAVYPTWRPLTDSMGGLSIHDLNFDLSDGTYNTIIAAVGSASSLSRDGGNRVGLLRSTDGGNTWTNISSLAGLHVRAVEARGNTILAGTNSGLFRSTNGGGSWTLLNVNTASSVTEAVTDLEADPNNLNRFYVAIPNHGVFRSDDAGATWLDITDFAMRNAINYVEPEEGDRSNESIRLAVYPHHVNGETVVYAGVITHGSLRAMFRSANSGIIWNQMDVPTNIEGSEEIGLQPREEEDHLPNVAGGQGAIHFSITADPNNPFVVYLGGDRQDLNQDGNFPNSIGADNYSGRLFRGDASQPRGNAPSPQWYPLTHQGTDNDSAPHADSRHLAFDAAGNLIEVDDGGIYKRTNPSTDDGRWTSLIGTLQVTEGHSVAYDRNTNTVLAGAQDTGTPVQLTPGGLTYQSYSQADGGQVAVDDTQAGTSIRYSSFQNLGAFTRSVIDVATNTVLSQTNPALEVFNSGGRTIYGFIRGGVQFYTPIVTNQIAPNRLLIGAAGGLFESFDGGETLIELQEAGVAWGSGVATALAYGGRDYQLPNAGFENADVIYAGTSTGEVFIRTTDIEALHETPTPFPDFTVVDLALNQQKWQHAYVISPSNVYRTRDAGNSWENITAGLGAFGVGQLRSIEYINGDTLVSTPLANLADDLIVVGTNAGVFARPADLSSGWVRFGANIPNAPVYDLDYDEVDRVLIASVLGRGIWALSGDLGAGSTPVSETLTASIAGAAFATEGDAARNVTISRSGSTAKALEVSLVSSDPRQATIQRLVTIPAGSSSVVVPLSIMDDATADGLANVSVRAFVAGFYSVADTLDIVDNDQAALTVTIDAPGSVNEDLGAAAIRGRVTRNSSTDADLVVTLVSSDEGEARVPQTVVIPAGETFVEFTINAVDEFISDGARNVNITAAAAGFVSGVGALVVEAKDNLEHYDRLGDRNLPREQGQLILSNNVIHTAAQWGVNVTAARDFGASQLPHTGSQRNLSEIGTQHLVPGLTIANNVFFNNTQGGVQMQGDANPASSPRASTLQARIANNTFYGSTTPKGIGVDVSRNASPTIMNNIFSFLTNGIRIDSTSDGSLAGSSPTEVLANLYHNAIASLGAVVESYAMQFDTNSELFLDPSSGNFYLQPGQIPAVDASLNTLQERAALTTVADPLGIPASTILAPDRDLVGQLRVDDTLVEPPVPGLGDNVYKDRGGIERSDEFGPVMQWLDPEDNGPTGLDINPFVDDIYIEGQLIDTFALQLTDTGGIGVDDDTVTSGRFLIERNGVLLRENIDYFFRYDGNNNVVRFVAAAGVWLNGNEFVITVDPDGAPITDLAGNSLLPNRVDDFNGQQRDLTRFKITLAETYNDKPVVVGPLSQTVLEDAPLVFNTANGNAITVFDVDAFNFNTNLPVRVTLTVTNGTLTLGNTANLTFLFGSDGTADTTMTFEGLLQDGLLNDINEALQGLTYQGNLHFNTSRGPETLVITVNDLGNSGNPLVQMVTTYAIPLTVTPVNDAPVLNNSGSPQLTNVLEDAPSASNPGDAVAAILATGAGGDPVTDPDFGDAVVPVEGIAIVAADNTNGAWQYSLNGGLTWLNVGNRSTASALLLRATDRLRFAPGTDFLGTVLVTFHAWDQTSGVAGGFADLSLVGATGGTTAYSTASETASVLIVAVNDPPIITAPAAATTNEDTNLVLTGPTGVSISDVDVNVGTGQLTVTLTVTNGTLTLGSVANLSFGTGDGTADSTMTFTGLLADLNTALTTLTYSPFPNYNGPESLVISANDLGNFGAGGPQITTHTVNITVTAVNDAPVLDNSGAPTLPTIIEDISSAANSGLTVAAMLLTGAGGNPITDVDAGAVEGIAVIGVSTSVNGLWQYSLDGGATWLDFTNPTLNAARLLRDTDRIRFQPAANFAGSASLTFHAWDRTQGTAGGTFDISGVGATGGTTAFSLASEIVSITVNPVNDPPVNNLPGPQSTAEDTPLVLSQANGNRISVFDPDIGSNPFQLTINVGNGAVTLNGVSGLSFSTGDGTNDSALVFTGTLVDINAALNGMAFTPAANFFGNATIQLILNDQGFFGSGGPLSDTDTLTINVLSIPDAPVLDNSGNPFFDGILEDVPQGSNPGTPITTMLSRGANGDPITDGDPGAVEGIAVIGLTDTANGTWQFSLDNGNTWSSFGTVSTSAARLLRDTDWVRFLPTFNFFGTPTMTFRAWDRTSGSQGTVVNLSNPASVGGSTAYSLATETATLAVTPVNDAPSFTKGPNQSSNEDAGPRTVPNWATQILAGPANESAQVLTFNVTSNSNPGLFSAGPAIAADGTLTYTAAANAFGTAVITIRLMDDGGTANGGNNLSGPQTFVITVNPVNDAPTINAIPNPAAIQEDSPPQVVNFSGVSVGPANETGQTIQVTASSSNTLLIPGPISVTYTSPNATGSLTYALAANVSGTAVITVTVKDTGGTSNGGVDTTTTQFTVTVNGVNDAPVATSQTVTTNEDTDRTVTLAATDPDFDPLTFRITTLPTNGSLFQTTNGTTRGAQITAVNTTVTDTQGRVIFAPAADKNGSPLTTFKFRASDGTLSSGDGTVTVNVTPVADGPRVTPVPDQNVLEDAADLVFGLNTIFFDPDVATNGDVLTFAVTANTNPGLIDAKLQSGNLVLDFLPDQNGVADITIRATDSTGRTTSDTFRVNVAAVNDPPQAKNLEVVAINGFGSLVGARTQFVDVDSPVVTTQLVSSPQLGTLTLLADGQFNYQVGPNFRGIDRFTYRVTDGQQTSNVATVEIVSLDFRLIRQLYRDHFLRTPSDAEALSQVDHLSAVGYQQLVHEVVTSIEYRGRIINDLYRQYLLRDAEPAGINFWNDVWSRFGGDEVVRAGIIGSPEFYQSAGGTNRDFVLALYQRLLGRTPPAVTDAEINYHVNRLNNGVSTGDIVLGFVFSDEYRGNLVAGFYQQYLKRPIDQPGRDYWIQRFHAGMTQDQVLESILYSAEYLRDDTLARRLGVLR